MNSATIEGCCRRSRATSWQIKETIPPSGLPPQASIARGDVLNDEEQEWSTNLAKLALLESIKIGSLAASHAAHSTYVSGAISSEEIFSGELVSLLPCRTWSPVGPLVNISVVDNSIVSGQTFFYAGSSSVPVRVASLGQNQVACQVVRILDSCSQNEGDTIELSQGQETPVPKNGEWSKWFKRLDSLKELKQGWDSYNAPSPASSAILIADALLRNLQESGTKPDRLSPSVVGGIGFTFKSVGLKVYVEISNRGSVHALFSDGLTDPIVQKVNSEHSSFTELISRIKTYLHE
jgi:hypothetical protein